MKCGGRILIATSRCSLLSRAIDLAHAAHAERRDDRVRAELTARHCVSRARTGVNAEVRRRLEKGFRIGLIREQ
jgi:hypothetical protein